LSDGRNFYFLKFEKDALVAWAGSLNADMM
jgi:hypothetical protein